MGAKLGLQGRVLQEQSDNTAHSRSTFLKAPQSGAKIVPAAPPRKRRETFFTVGKQPVKPLFLAPGVANDRQVACRQLAQVFRPVRNVGVEIEAVAGLQQVGLVAVTIPDLALQHEQELDPLMLEDRKDVRILAEGDEV